MQSFKDLSYSYTVVDNKPVWKCLPPYPTASQPDIDADHYIDSRDVSCDTNISKQPSPMEKS